jgi:hypothetical protein
MQVNTGATEVTHTAHRSSRPKSSSDTPSPPGDQVQLGTKDENDSITALSQLGRAAQAGAVASRELSEPDSASPFPATTSPSLALRRKRDLMLAAEVDQLLLKDS